MPPVGIHIRDTMLEAAWPELAGVYRAPAATSVSGAERLFGPSAITAYLDNEPIDTIEWSLAESVAAAPHQTDATPAILPEIFKRLRRTNADRLVVCLPESWRSAPVIPPSQLQRQMAQAFPACEIAFVGSSQAAGASVIRQARQHGLSIGSKLIVFNVNDSDCELAEFAVEQPGDRLRPIRNRAFPGIGAFDQAIGRLISRKNGADQRRNAIVFAKDRTAKEEALALEWEFIADLPDTEVIASAGQSILVGEVLSSAESIWQGLGAEIERFITSASRGEPSGSVMWASVGQVASLPLLHGTVDDAMNATGINRIDGQFEPWRHGSAILDGALNIAAGNVDPRIMSNGASMNVWRRLGVSIATWSIPFDPYEVGGYLPSPLRPEPNADPSSLQIRTGLPVSITLGQKEYASTLEVPAGDYFVGIHIDQEHRTTLVCTDAANPQRVYTVPVS